MTTTFDDRDLRVALTDASLDAPRVDLWARIEPSATGVVQRRRPLRRTLQAIAAMLAVVLAGGAMMAVFSLADDVPTARRGNQLSAVPDMILSQSWNASNNAYDLRAYLPGSNEVRTILQDGGTVTGEPLVTRDGEQFIYQGLQDIDDTRTFSIWVLDSQTLAPQWKADIASVPLSVDLSEVPAVRTSVAQAGDRVYVASHIWGATDPTVITAWDRMSGTKVGEWSVAFDGLASFDPSLFASPDGSVLYLLTSVNSDANPNVASRHTAYARFSLPAMHEEQRVVQESNSGQLFPTNDTAMTSDGKLLYSVGTGGPVAGSYPVSFFDLTTGQTLPEITFPIKTSEDVWLAQHAVSNDGKRLYVFIPTTAEMGIINLETHEVERTVKIEMSVVQGSNDSFLGRVWGRFSGLFIQDASAKGGGFMGTMQFSPEGGRLYAINWSGDSFSGQPQGVLVINTSTWQVIDHWLPDTEPGQVVLGGTGHYLYVNTGVYGGSDAPFRVIDTTTGGEVLATDGINGVFYSPAELYREAYGIAPEVIGVDAKDLHHGTLDSDVPFATLSASVSTDAIVSGNSVTVEAHYLAPDTREPVREGDDAYRFNKPNHITATLARGSSTSDEVTIVLTEAEYGVYHGAGMLTTPGTWSVKVVAKREGESSRYATLDSAVVVQQAFTGTDGRRYMLRSTTDPATPGVEQPFTLHVAFVDAETGAPLPDGVDITSGLPDSMRASLFSEGVTSGTLAPSGHGVYSGTFTIWSATAWTVQVDFPNDGMTAGSIQAGVVEGKR